jgi:hypothetical protein
VKRSRKERRVTKKRRAQRRGGRKEVKGAKKRGVTRVPVHVVNQNISQQDQLVEFWGVVCLSIYYINQRVEYLEFLLIILW